jgi:hypothetical protein
MYSGVVLAAGFFSVRLLLMFSCVPIFAGLIVSHRKDENFVKTKPLNKRLLSTVVVCYRLLSDK